MHGEPKPVHAPCGMGSALWYTCVMGTGGIKEFPGKGGGRGMCRRVAARRSPGLSKATDGRPKVEPKSEARAPPNEWPTSQISDDG